LLAILNKNVRKNLPALLIPVVISGGVGSRLWPLSREGQPKPFIKLTDGETLLEKTYRRIAYLPNVPKVNGKSIVISVTNKEYYFLNKDELDKVNLFGIFLLEPEARGTAAAITMAAHWIKKKYGINASMLVLPADHIIQSDTQFALKVEEALMLNNEIPPYISILGINPRSPDEGFGYIKAGKPLPIGFKVNRFYEKPDLKSAKKLLESKKIFWNSGIFCCKISQFLDEIAKYSPEVFKQTLRSFKSSMSSLAESKIEISKKSFKNCPSLSIDHALMERSKHIAVIPSIIGWNDIGSWLNYTELCKSDYQKNTLIGNGLLIKSKNTFIQTNKRYIAAVGVQNLIIIDTADALLVLDKAHSQDVRLVTSELKMTRQEILHSHQKTKRPWGSFTVLDYGASYKIKSITVNPLKSLSLQSHQHRSEHWVVIEGEAEITNQGKVYRIKKNESTFIAQGSKHRLSNPLKRRRLIIIEVQSGLYLGEDDIKRYEDEFGRI
jgi:mannose-1-phosphate guanylyltransferase